MSEINFVQTDVRILYDAILELLQEFNGEQLRPGDERLIFMESQLSVITALYNTINDVGRQNLLRYARGAVLDALGERVGCTRIASTPAGTSLLFTLSAPLSYAVTIPAGTRATPDGEVYFATKVAATIAIGEIIAIVAAQSTTNGDVLDGFDIGTVNKLVDLVPMVATVTNTIVTSGGQDIEDDDTYRERIRLAPNSFSTAGPIGAYEYWARSADSGIIDVSVSTPTPGMVEIVVLMEDGELPDASVLAAVFAACNERTRRPLTDSVTAVAPTTVAYNINIHYYVDADIEAAVVASVESEGGAIDQYKAWQCGALGRDVNPDYLRKLILDAGATRLTVTAPTYAVVEGDEVALFGTPTITHEVNA